MHCIPVLLTMQTSFHALHTHSAHHVKPLCIPLTLKHTSDYASYIHTVYTQGLVKVDISTGTITLMSTRASSTSPLDPGLPLVYANDLDIATEGGDGSGGVVYFTTSQEIPVGLHPQLGFWDTFSSFMLGLFSVGGGLWVVGW